MLGILEWERARKEVVSRLPAAACASWYQPLLLKSEAHWLCDGNLSGVLDNQVMRGMTLQAEDIQ